MKSLVKTTLQIDPFWMVFRTLSMEKKKADFSVVKVCDLILEEVCSIP